MSAPSQVIVLAEDERQQSFVRQYLYRLRFKAHDIRFEKTPGASGCGEQWVRERYAAAVCAYRARAARASTALIVIIDADTNEVVRRAEQLQQALSHADLATRSPHEKIVHLIPKRHVETWIHCLSGSAADEETDYKGKLHDIEKLTKSAAVALFELSRASVPLLSACVPSLEMGIRELKRLD